MNRCDLYYAVNVLCREVAKWTKACGRRLYRLICYMNQTADLCITSFVGDRLEDMRIALYTDASFADCLKTSKYSTGGYLCLVGPRSFIPLTWLCKKQHAVSHSSTESEVIALDTTLRLEGLPALNFMDAALEVLCPEPKVKNSQMGLEPKRIQIDDPWGVDQTNFASPIPQLARGQVIGPRR